MKKLFLASSAIASLAFTVNGTSAEEIKLGVLLGFTGPIESLVPPIADAAEMAIREASDSGMLLGGSTVTPVRGDSTCVDSAAAVAAAERMITSDGVNAIVGGRLFRRYSGGSDKCCVAKWHCHDLPVSNVTGTFHD